MASMQHLKSNVIPDHHGNGKLDTSEIAILDKSSDEWSAIHLTHSEEEEDYDNLKPDPATLVEGGKGGGAEQLELPPAANMSSYSTAEDSSGSNPEDSHSYANTHNRRRSVHVILEETKKGRYVLRADEPEVRDILRRITEKEAAAVDASDKKSRVRFRDLVFTRQFTTFDRQNPLSSESPFHGFFTLFWLCMALLLVKIAAQNWKLHGSVFGEAQLLHMMFERDVTLLGITDGVMCAGTLFGYFLQKVIAKGYIRWNTSGWIIQNLWQTFYLGAVIGWTVYRDWPWTHTVFIVLHGLAFVMKQHSYAFYNGYLSQIYRRRRLLQEKLDQLDTMEASPTSRPSSPSNTRSTALEKLNGNGTGPQRRKSLGPRTSTNLRSEKSEVSSIVHALESDEPLDHDQLKAFSELIQREIDSLSQELKGKCTTSGNSYPNNLTLSNFCDWTLLPTLVYELEYPRLERINWWYVAEKTAATFGVIWVMMVISQQYIYPLVKATVTMKEQGMTLQERWSEFPWILSDMLFPLLLEQLLTWYVIWECCLNVLAELTYFADRGFYGAWWNSETFDQYARDWNRPVHNFLLRHVYHSSISSFHLSKQTATFVTFLLSACVHELVMLCIFKKVRGYLFLMQLSQIPLVSLSRTKLLRNKGSLGNIIFWFGLFVGPSFITSLYLIV
ncbi:MBOAT-domain-containing protein [Aulographum hederae CBS 113979]|uniref:O-acyltransferase n=1 Tax=Aulographum hederae CBS 113979 TaxID=1176131 RepID=A0A6G1GWN7_9PEZI|nr:MBOAT-domain-containing protein [Aulographum hederae CBS 113979]